VKIESFGEHYLGLHSKLVMNVSLLTWHIAKNFKSSSNHIMGGLKPIIKNFAH
jgi:hypothetical protein